MFTLKYLGYVINEKGMHSSDKGFKLFSMPQPPKMCDTHLKNLEPIGDSMGVTHDAALCYLIIFMKTLLDNNKTRVYGSHRNN